MRKSVSTVLTILVLGIASVTILSCGGGGHTAAAPPVHHGTSTVTIWNYGDSPFSLVYGTVYQVDVREWTGAIAPGGTWTFDVDSDSWTELSSQFENGIWGRHWPSWAFTSAPPGGNVTIAITHYATAPTSLE